jgi:hypothetical protein
MSAREWVWAPALIAAGMIGPGLAAAPTASAGPVEEYAAVNADAICTALAERPYLSTVTVILKVIVDDTGWSNYDAGVVVGQTVRDYCPWNRGVVERFIRVYAPEARGGRSV